MRTLFILSFVLSYMGSSGQNTINNHIQKVDTLIANKGTFYITKVEKLYIVGEAAIPPEKNYTANIDSTSIVAKPLQGIWGNPFYAYPLADSSSNGDIISGGRRIFTVDRIYQIIQYNNIKLQTLVFSSPDLGPATNHYGYLFRFKKFPSLLIFGDLNDTTTWHTIALKDSKH